MVLISKVHWFWQSFAEHSEVVSYLRVPISIQDLYGNVPCLVLAILLQLLWTLIWKIRGFLDMKEMNKLWELENSGSVDENTEWLVHPCGSFLSIYLSSIIPRMFLWVFRFLLFVQVDRLSTKYLFYLQRYFSKDKDDTGVGSCRIDLLDHIEYLIMY